MTFEEMFGIAVDHGSTEDMRQPKPSMDVLSNSMFAGAVEELQRLRLLQSTLTNAEPPVLGLSDTFPTTTDTPPFSITAPRNDVNALPLGEDATSDQTVVENFVSGFEDDTDAFEQEFGPITSGPFQSMPEESSQPSIEEIIRGIIRRA